jgi:hypothetical protein
LLLRRHDVATRQDDGNSPAKEFDQEMDASGIIEIDKFPQSITQRAGLDPDRLTDAQRFHTPQAALVIGFASPHFDDPSRQRHGTGVSAGRHQPLYANGAVDAAPLIVIEVQRDEEIAEKKRHAPDFDPACVAPCLLPQGQKRLESLVVELDRRTMFAVAFALDGEPPLAWQQLSAVPDRRARVTRLVVASLGVCQAWPAWQPSCAALRPVRTPQKQVAPQIVSEPKAQLW